MNPLLTHRLDYVEVISNLQDQLGGICWMIQTSDNTTSFFQSKDVEEVKNQITSLLLEKEDTSIDLSKYRITIGEEGEIILTNHDTSLFFANNKIAKMVWEKLC